MSSKLNLEYRNDDLMYLQCALSVPFAAFYSCTTQSTMANSENCRSQMSSSSSGQHSASAPGATPSSPDGPITLGQLSSSVGYSSPTPVTLSLLSSMGVPSSHPYIPTSVQ